MTPKEDSFYTKAGVTPPSHEAHLTEDEISEQLATPRKHLWFQRGAQLFCSSCPWEHATEPLFRDYLLIGTDDNGKPLLKKIGK